MKNKNDPQWTCRQLNFLSKDILDSSMDKEEQLVAIQSWNFLKFMEKFCFYIKKKKKYSDEKKNVLQKKN